MKVISNEKTVFFDVDETLVLAPKDPDGTILLKDLAIVADPLYPDGSIKRLKHHAMIRLLREEHQRGSFVVVWSRGGFEWAAAVIHALGLESCVDLIMTKPMVYFDDLPIEEWLPHRVYIAPGITYK